MRIVARGGAGQAGTTGMCRGSNVPGSSRSVSRVGLERGFTLLELLIVVALIGIIAALAVPQFKNTPQKAKEAVLKEDLYILRDVIDQHFTDKGRYPSTLQDLVDAGYLRKIPVDPLTNSSETWKIETVPIEEGEDAATDTGGVYDVHSGAPGTALDGTSYSEW